MLCVIVLKKTEVIEQPAEEPKTIKLGKGKLPDDEDTRDGATLKPVIVEPEVSILSVCQHKCTLTYGYIWIYCGQN